MKYSFSKHTWDQVDDRIRMAIESCMDEGVSKCIIIGKDGINVIENHIVIGTEVGYEIDSEGEMKQLHKNPEDYGRVSIVLSTAFNEIEEGFGEGDGLSSALSLSVRLLTILSSRLSAIVQAIAAYLGDDADGTPYGRESKKKFNVMHSNLSMVAKVANSVVGELSELRLLMVSKPIDYHRRETLEGE